MQFFNTKIHKLMPYLYIGTWDTLEIPDTLRQHQLTNILALYEQKTIEQNLLIWKRQPFEGIKVNEQIKRTHITYPDDFYVEHIAVSFEQPFTEAKITTALNFMDTAILTGQNLLISSPYGIRDELAMVTIACHLLKQGFPMTKIWRTILEVTDVYGFSERHWRVFIDRADTDWETLRQLAKEIAP